MFYATLHLCKSEFPYNSMLLFRGFDTINDNCYWSLALYTERVKSHCAAEQEVCSTVLKVGKSHKTNPSCGMRDIIHAVSTSTKRLL